MSFFGKKDQPAAEHEIDGERGNPNINAEQAPTKKIGRIILCCAVLLLILFALFRYYAGIAEERAQRDAEQKKDTSKSVTETLPPLSVPPPPAPPTPPAVSASPAAMPKETPANAKPTGPQPTYYKGAQQQKREPSPAELIAARKRSAPVTFSVGANLQPQQVDDEERRLTSVDDALSKNLVASATPKASATLLGDRNFLLTKGTFIDATLESAMDSSVPGMVSALVASDVYSANGHVVLLERGTKLTGEYRGTIQPGQSRLFVLWTRAETPQGVLINLDSPSTDQLGRTGADGYIDYHWGLRLGSAFLLSAWSDGIEIAGNVIASRTNGNTIYTYDNTEKAGEQMATEALRHTMNIPPTLYKNQGETIRVFVARDLDFSSVYKLRPSGGF